MRKRFIVCDPKGNEVGSPEYPSRREAENGAWRELIGEDGYVIKRINLVIKETLPCGTVVWERKGSQQ